MKKEHFVLFFMVRETGLEPVRCKPHWITRAPTLNSVTMWTNALPHWYPLV